MFRLSLPTVTVPQTELQTLFTLATGAVQVSQLPDGIQLASHQQPNGPAANTAGDSSAAATSAANTSSNSTSALLRVPALPASYAVTQPVANMLLSFARLSSASSLATLPTGAFYLFSSPTWHGTIFSAVR
jgi:hypothetical protein